MPTDLYHLQSTAHPMIDEAFLRGDREITFDDVQPYLTSLGLSVDLKPIDERIEEIREDDEIEEHESEIDAELAPTLHRTLDISRYHAADDGLWHYLSVVEYADFIHYRWDHVYDPENPDNMEEKFLGAGADIYSNALHRLWWAAELTYEEPAEEGGERNYDRTRKVLRFQELANDVFDRWFARYRPVAEACVDLLCHDTLDEVKDQGEYSDPPSNSEIVDNTTTLLREELTVRRVEVMEKEDVEDIVTELRDEVMRGEA